MRHAWIGLPMAALGTLLATSAAQAIPSNLVRNGSFESYENGVFTGWTNVGTAGTTPMQYATQHPTNGTKPGQFQDIVPPDPFTFSTDKAGDFGAYFVADNTDKTPGGQGLQQSIKLTAGTQYEVGFDLFATRSGAANANPFSLTGSINGIVIVTATAANTTVGEWRHYSATFTATETPGGGDPVFDFTFLSGDTPAKDVIADLVYVGEPITPVPEPASIAMLGLGLVGLGIARRRQAS